MKMTWELSQALMADLACLFISAEGGAEIDENGNFDKGQMERASEYARCKFTELAEQLEEITGEEWQIDAPNEE